MKEAQVPAAEGGCATCYPAQISIPTRSRPVSYGTQIFIRYLQVTVQLFDIDSSFKANFVYIFPEYLIWFLFAFNHKRSEITFAPVDKTILPEECGFALFITAKSATKRNVNLF